MAIYNPPIPICALTSEKGCGKTLFPILSADDALDKTKPPKCVVYDLEGSAETYRHSLNFEWHDIRGMLSDGLHMKTAKPKDTDPNWKKLLLTNTEHVNDYPDVSMFRAVFMSIMLTEPGQFQVCSVDTWTPLQMGCAEWLKLHPMAFHRTANQYIKAGSMYLIPDARKMLEYILTVDCRSRFEMTCLTFHQKNEWVGQGDSARKTGDRISEQWELIDNVATLAATLDRKPKAKGKSAPRVPSALLTDPYGKSRMMIVRDGKLIPALPPRMPEFTPEAIREYFTNPPDYYNLKVGERMPADELSEDERLRLQAGIEQDRRVTAELHMSAMEAQQRGMSAQAAAVAGGTKANQTTVASQQGQQPAQPPAASPQQVAMITPGQQKRIVDLLPKCFDNPAEFAAILKDKIGVQRISELTESKATDVEVILCKIATQRSQQAAKEKLEASEAKRQAESESDAPTTAEPASQPSNPSGNARDPNATIGEKRIPAIIALMKTQKLDLDDVPMLMKQVAGNEHAKISELTNAQADALAKLIPKHMASKKQAEAESQSDPPTKPADGNITAEQLERLKQKVGLVGWSHDDQVAWLKSRGYGSFRSLKYNEADDLISELLQVELGYKEQMGK